MRPFLATFPAILSVCAVAACQLAGASQYDGVSRFAAGSPYYGPGSGPRETPPAPETPANGGQGKNI